MNKIEIFNKKMENYIQRALTNPYKISLIYEEAKCYTENILSSTIKQNSFNEADIVLIYRYRHIFSKLINLELINEKSKSNFLSRFIFFFKLRKIKSPYDLSKFSQIVATENVNWVNMFSKFTPPKEILKVIKREKVETLNKKRAKLVSLNLSLNHFQEFLIKLYGEKDKYSYAELILLILSCGRRPTEIFSKNTTFVVVGDKLLVSGLAKKRGGNKIDKVLFSTFLPPELIISLRNSLLKKFPNYSEKSTHSKKANKFFKEVEKEDNIKEQEVENINPEIAHNIKFIKNNLENDERTIKPRREIMKNTSISERQLKNYCLFKRKQFCY